MFKETLAPQTAQTLEILKQSSSVKDFYLAGGTALALQLGHRISEDLDWFGNREFKPLQLLSSIKSEIPGLEITNTNQSWGTLKFFHGLTMVSFFTYLYPLLEPTDSFKQIQVASPPDIGCMKITSIADRGVRKDFIDLYFLCQEIDFTTLFQKFEEKYSQANFEPYHYLKALAYFEEAENSPSPHMLKPIDWDQVKNFFRKKVKNYPLP